VLARLARVEVPRKLHGGLKRADPAGEAAAPRAIAFGLLNLLRQLGAGRPLLVAVDDLQWVDQPTAEVLAFAVRRLGGPSVRFLFAARTGLSSAVERALAPAGPQILEVGPLSVGAMRRMLSDHLGLALPRYVLRQVYDTTLGNPLFALEVGRTLAERGVPALGHDLPVPDTVEELLGKRVSRLAAPVRRATPAGRSARPCSSARARSRCTSRAACSSWAAAPGPRR